MSKPNAKIEKCRSIIVDELIDILIIQHHECDHVQYKSIDTILAEIKQQVILDLADYNQSHSDRNKIQYD